MGPLLRFSTAPSLLALLCLGGLLLSGCASSGGTASRTDRAGGGSWSPAEAESRLRAAADRWVGAPHEWGGTSQQGVDCSGLVQTVYAEAFRMRLPRTTEKQADVGRAVSRSQLQPGDLVFFRPGWKKRHVGIYLSDGEFLHASSSEGVTVSLLERSYWREHWWRARRLLPAAGDTTRVRAESSPRRRPAQSVGW